VLKTRTGGLWVLAFVVFCYYVWLLGKIKKFLFSGSGLFTWINVIGLCCFDLHFCVSYWFWCIMHLGSIFCGSSRCVIGFC
jgi:hypothetical protein